LKKILINKLHAYPTSCSMVNDEWSTRLMSITLIIQCSSSVMKSS